MTLYVGKLEVCGAAEFECDNGECIVIDFVCDGHADCRDSTDELHCGLSHYLSFSSQRIIYRCLTVMGN